VDVSQCKEMQEEMIKYLISMCLHVSLEILKRSEYGDEFWSMVSITDG